MPELIKQFLKNYLSQNTHWKALLLQNWPSIIGDLGNRVTLEKIQDDLLVLGVTDSSWLQELYVLSPVILQTINGNLDQPRIKRLRFKQLGRKKKNQHTPEYTSKKIETDVTFKKKEQEALNAIEDDQLRTALKKFLIRCYQENV